MHSSLLYLLNQSQQEQHIETITKREKKETLPLFLMVTVGNEEVSCACSIPLCGWKKKEIHFNFSFFLPWGCAT